MNRATIMRIWINKRVAKRYPFFMSPALKSPALISPTLKSDAIIQPPFHICLLLFCNSILYISSLGLIIVLFPLYHPLKIFRMSLQFVGIWINFRLVGFRSIFLSLSIITFGNTSKYFFHSRDP
jgi:hypothetical protein